MTNICMIDLETLATSADAYILSIGAVVFDSSSNVFLPSAKFYEVLSLEEQAGSRISTDTLCFWLKQSELARNAISCCEKVSIEEALNNLYHFIKNNKVEEVYSNGASFDIPILELAYTKYIVEIPWSHKASRCFRTMKALFWHVKEPEFTGEAHNALADARHQAEWLYLMLQEAKEKLQ